MADVVSPQKRSEMMAGIRGADTKPELMIRKGLHAAGYRYRLHGKGLPGRPDIVLRKYNALVFVHGCFWHGHDCHLFKWPKSRPEFWREKIGGNRERDERNIMALLDQGWRIATVWECALKGKLRRDPGNVIEELADWLESDIEQLEIRGMA
jgi:DNA mismatch endonuclease (patch repair protein)